MQNKDDRFVAYFDMIGMKEAILRNQEIAWVALSDLYAAKERIYEISIEVVSTGHFIRDRVRTFIFSDTIIIFTRSDKPEDLYSILILSSELFSNSLHRCVPLRGGIAHGQFFFNLDHSLFLGAPLIRAYQIGEEAQWAGITVDEAIFQRSKTIPLKTAENTDPIIPWAVPLKERKTKLGYVLNWPKIFKHNFMALPASLVDFYSTFEHLFGPYDALHDDVKVKYENTIDFINSQLIQK
jgi:hypothetical protein